MKKILIKISVFLIIVVNLFVFSACDFFEDNSNTSITYSEKNWGETFDFESLDITLNDYEFKYWAKSGSLEAGSNKVWLIINAEVYNKTSKRIDLNCLYDKVVYINDGEEASYNSTYYQYSDWINAHSYIDPYETIYGMFMYRIPEGIAPVISGYPYEYGGKYSSNQTNNINFEFRIKNNLQSVRTGFVVKL